MALPIALPVAVTEHEPEERVHEPWTETAVEFDEVKETVPVGTRLESFTVAVQYEVEPLVMVSGMHDTEVVVLPMVIVRDTVLLLGALLESPL